MAQSIRYHRVGGVELSGALASVTVKGSRSMGNTHRPYSVSLLW